jgi:GNAT superfamily N-acetyltransferase
MKGRALVGMNIHALRQDDVGAAASVIARAFHGDPLTGYLYPDDPVRLRLAPLMFEAFVRYDCLFGEVDYLPGFAAVATWLPPGDDGETPERLASAGFDRLPDEIPLKAIDEFFAAIAPAHERAAPTPHWYLRLLGVEPSDQGRGFGAALLQHGLKRADADGHGCYLETFAERNVPFYLRHGFELVVDEVERHSGIHTWGFYRPARL